MCVNYRELNKATKDDYFPLPFINQCLDNLAWRNYVSFLDGFNGSNQIWVALDDQAKMIFTCPWGIYSYRVLPFGLCNVPTTFQRVVLAIFVVLTTSCVKFYMDGLTAHGKNFDESLEILEKFLQRCEDH